MSVNSSSSSNSSLPPPLPPPSSHNMYSFAQTCLEAAGGAVHITAFAAASVLLLLPVCLFVLYLAVQRRRRRRRPGSAASHSDVLAHHMAASELTSVSGSLLLCCGAFTDLRAMVVAGLSLFLLNSCGQMFYHLLTCVERYLAVVHAVSYRNLSKAKGVWIRNASTGCVWLLSFIWTSFTFVHSKELVSASGLAFLVVTVTVVSSCSLAVLCVLIRPGPGARQKPDQSKLRAFHTMAAILGVLLLKFGGNMVFTGLFGSAELEEDGKCGVWFLLFWISLPSSLVLPLLFLNRAGKLTCQKNSATSGGSD
ncbi:uncharacterized protein V6R79_014106 [Siganus canaliculatus]